MIILITGERNIGKTTIINKLSKDFNCTGIITEEFCENGNRTSFIMRDLNENPSKDHKIATMSEKFSPIVNRETFETYGVSLCQKAMRDTQKVVIIDEIGVFEEQCFLYQKALQELITCGKIIIAVLKKRNSNFLCSLNQKYPVISVNLQNREQIYFDIKTQIERNLK